MQRDRNDVRRHVGHCLKCVDINHIGFLCFTLVSCVSHWFPVFHIGFLCFTFVSCVSRAFPVFHIRLLCFTFIRCVSHSFAVIHIRLLCFTFVSCVSHSFAVFQIARGGLARMRVKKMRAMYLIMDHYRKYKLRAYILKLVDIFK